MIPEIREQTREEQHDPHKERNWGKPNYLDRLQELDSIIQHTPINERATSEACQYAYKQLKVINRPRFHKCMECDTQYGNSETRIKDDLSNLYGVCPKCKEAREG